VSAAVSNAATASTADAQGKSRLTFTDSSPFLRFSSLRGMRKVDANP
jgi:hypothetical protein